MSAGVLLTLLIGACARHTAVLEVDIGQHRAVEVEVLRDLVNVPERIPMIAEHACLIYLHATPASEHATDEKSVSGER